MMNIEIIPNWHPILVHFTIGLLSMSVALLLVGTLIRKGPLHSQLATAARWNLWLGAALTIGTVLSGLYAFNTVPHQLEAQHLAMLDHRKWALSTATLFLALAAWSLVANLRGKAAFAGFRHYIFVTLMVVAGLMLAATGYKGGELVYRHGLGVMAIPAMEEEHHNRGGHDHGEHHH